MCGCVCVCVCVCGCVWVCVCGGGGVCVCVWELPVCVCDRCLTKRISQAVLEAYYSDLAEYQSQGLYSSLHTVGKVLADFAVCDK